MLKITLAKMGEWLSQSIGRKLLFAFLLVFVLTYLVTALVVQGAIRTAVTDAELKTLAEQARLKLSSFETMYAELSVDLAAWSRQEVMNDLAGGDVDKRVKHALDNLKKDYVLKGDIYAFNTEGALIATTNVKQISAATLPKIWKVQGGVDFIDKHANPFGLGDVIALTTPVMLDGVANSSSGTLVVTQPWSEIKTSLPERTLLLRHLDLPKTSETLASIVSHVSSTIPAHNENIMLLESTLNTPISEDLLYGLAHQQGWVSINSKDYMVNNAEATTSLLAGWEVVVLREPATLQQTLWGVALKLTVLGLILSVPLVFGVRWLANLLTSPLRNLTEFVTDITKTQNLSKRVVVDTHDELGTLATAFNQMTIRLESGVKVQRENEARLRTIIDSALDGVVQTNAVGIIISWNAQAENIFGWVRAETIGRKLHEIILPKKLRSDTASSMSHFLPATDQPVQNSRIEKTGIHRDGYEFPMEISIATIDRDGQLEYSVFIRDITHRKKSEEVIWKQANFDTLTGLPNRRMFYDRLSQEVKKAQRGQYLMALFFIDLDRFKEVNDTLGHDKGDLLLVEASRRIVRCVRQTDTVARLGGDEFTVILPELDDANVDRIAKDILKELAEPFHLGSDVVYVSGSVGIALYPIDATETEALLKAADQSMYVAKNAGRNCLAYFTPALQGAAQTRLRLLSELRTAIATDQLQVYYQPIFDLSTGRIQKAETLLRWLHPERGMISPAEFIPLAEESGLIVEIGDWVFKAAALQVKQWRTQFDLNFQVSVNMSPLHFRSNGSDYQSWLNYLKELDLPGTAIVIEITEGLLLDAETSVTSRLTEFRAAGMQVAIDDFGTGYSSLSYLKKFEIDYLKIDKSFVRDLTSDPNDLALSEAIIVMAHKLGLKVIAEGVETEPQRVLLATAGCDYVQGYLYSEPVIAEDFSILLKALLV